MRHYERSNSDFILHPHLLSIFIIKASMMDKSCMVLFHLSTGDNFTMYAAVRHFQKIYKEVFIFCLHRNRYTVTQLYEPYSNVHILIIHQNYNNYLAPPHLIEHFKSQTKGVDLFVTGFHDPNFDVSGRFWEKFYVQLHLPYSMRYDYEDINRNKEKELNLHNAIVSKYGEKYIFLHDHRNIEYKHYYERSNVYVESNLPVFHPNFNYYDGLTNNCHGHLWSSEFMSDNLLDYCTLIENATEIHVSDSAFSCLMPFLDLKNVKKKCIYTDYDEIPTYHEQYKNWEIVKR
jgi:hypothetical protein